MKRQKKILRHLLAILGCCEAERLGTKALFSSASALTHLFQTAMDSGSLRHGTSTGNDW